MSATIISRVVALFMRIYLERASAENIVELTFSWVPLGMKKRDSQGHVFLCGQLLQLADQRMAA